MCLLNTPAGAAPCGSCSLRQVCDPIENSRPLILMDFDNIFIAELSKRRMDCPSLSWQLLIVQTAEPSSTLVLHTVCSSLHSVLCYNLHSSASHSCVEISSAQKCTEHISSGPPLSKNTWCGLPFNRNVCSMCLVSGSTVTAPFTRHTTAPLVSFEARP